MNNGQSPDVATSSSHSTPSPNNAHHTHDESRVSATPRVPLACLRCRAKRARCSGDRPVCQSCQKAGEECEWPAGRRRKRTRREMEADERREREEQEAHAARANMHSTPSPHSGLAPPGIPWSHAAVPSGHGMWSFQQNTTAPGPSNFIWPPQNISQSSLSSPYESHPPNGFALPSPHPNGAQSGAAQLVQAMNSDVAFIEGDPSRQEGLELYYYRFSGSTAITPGINRISLKLQPRPANPNLPENAAPLPTTQSRVGSPHPPPAMFDSSGMPVPEIAMPMLERFFSTMCQHFPSIQRDRMEQRFATGTMSAFMLNCICAVTARFMPNPKDPPAKVCAPFITKAQELIIPLLHLPTTDVVTGLLLLAWANYGQNSDSGFWQYSGICFRMSQDLGLHEVSDIYETPRHVVRTRLLFWSFFITDRILSFQTGRPFSISEDVIEIPLPSDEDMYPDPAGRTPPNGSTIIEPCAFPALVRLMVLCGRIANVLNGRRGRTRTLIGPSSADPQLLSGLQRQLVQFYSDLPPSLRWSVETFKQQEARGHGGVFLTLHLWANAVMALVYHPELITGSSGTQTPLTSTMDRSIKLSLASSRIISECLVFADLLSADTYLASPFIAQPIYVASLALLYDMKLSTLGFEQPPTDLQPPTPSATGSSPEFAVSPSSASPPIQSNSAIPPSSQPSTAETSSKEQHANAFLTSLTKQNLDVLRGALQRMEHYWSGVGYITGVLSERAAAVGLRHIYNLEGGGKKTFISLPDRGLLRRFAPDMPKSVRPPTETSLREAISDQKKNSEAVANMTDQWSVPLNGDPNTFVLDDLMSSYSIEGLFVSPADHYDLENLLNMGHNFNGPS